MNKGINQPPHQHKHTHNRKTSMANIIITIVGIVVFMKVIAAFPTITTILVALCLVGYGAAAAKQ